MSKREYEGDFDGPPSKMRKDDQDDGSGGGRSGRVRKKSAKVLEMEEFEQVERTQHVTKKGKTPKTPGRQPSVPDEQDFPPVEKTVLLSKKTKTPKAPASGSLQLQSSVEATPVTSKVVKSELSAHLSKPVQQFVPVQTSGILSTGLTGGMTMNPTDLLAATMKQEFDTDLSIGAELALPQQIMQTSPVKTEDQKSVIKYLLSSPTSNVKPAVNTNTLAKVGAVSATNLDFGSDISTGKKPAKKKTQQDKPPAKAKPKEKKQKPGVSSPTSMDVLGMDQGSASLKMKIFGSSDPMTAQVTLNPKSETDQPGASKPKKAKKPKVKPEPTDAPLDAEMLDFASLDSEDLAGSDVKKPQKKVSKKKEKLIRDAISAAQQMPNLAALVASQTHLPGQIGAQVTIATPVQKPQKPQKKKAKTPPSASLSDDAGDSLIRSDLSFGDDGEEANLVIAETEKKRKKRTYKKKALAGKEKGASGSPKGEKAEKKLSKRAPTAYMLFCNTHRPTIVNENPGIEFAGISRKLGEMWQTLSNKQKLQWRRKAQRRRKKGSNLISTGKTGKETAAAASGLAPSSSGQGQATPGLKLSTLMQKTQRTSPDDTPQSPTKNFSIEPIDVAAHLKLLGESLSIIGMRLQEHKGMIAVQGSLSVLLDSLLCACGPLLCLTQQVPGMDGCSPLVHGQTLDSVAYVMPGL